ncbi:MAG TPA: bifunctional DNA primase/polymerase, partial [Polyangiaceae bacterium]|nr:bifunctional DNA primase/polymerase [Polyangiaceae bacterium]
MNAPDVLTLVRAARDLTRIGQPVFPCKTSGERAKAPYTRNGLKDATLDLDRIKYWWRQQPDAAIGLPTGIIWDVLDVDIKDTADGRVHLPMLNRLGLLNGCKDVVRTPSGGWHLYFPST